MRLKELLQTLPPDKHIKIGAKDGSNYFYVGNPADMLATFKKRNKCYQQYDKIIYDAANNLVTKIETEIKSLYSGVARQESEMVRQTIIERIIHADKRYSEALEKRDKIVPLAEREVFCVFEADEIVDEGTTAIIVDGTEFGRFWTYDEARRGFGKIVPTLRIGNMEVTE